MNFKELGDKLSDLFGKELMGWKLFCPLFLSIIGNTDGGSI